MKITKEWLKPHSPCSDGYGWFLKKFPQGADFDEVYAGLREEKRYSDCDWLVEKAFNSLSAGEITQELVKITGADAEKITSQVHADGAHPDATATTGDYSNAATTGYRSNAATTGECSNAATTGYRSNAATTGKNSIAVSLGNNAKVMAGDGGVLVLKYWDKKANRPRVKVGYVGEDGIKKDVWYGLDENFQFAESGD